MTAGVRAGIAAPPWADGAPGLLDPELERAAAAGAERAALVAELPDRLAATGLRGRGGAGFPVARKLAAVLASPDPRVIVANGEEGEPASIKDRYLLRHRPHLVLDGLALLAAAAGAQRAIVYVADAAAEASVRRAAADTGRAVEVFRVAHSYVAGEESALVRALDGGPALPTAKPPRPFEAGVGGRPTLVQNVETLAQVSRLARQPGPIRPTFLATVSGGGRAGLYEVPFGVPLGDLAAQHGIEKVRGVLAGGLFGGLLTAAALDAPLDYDAFRTLGSGLGCGAFVLLGEHDCPVDAAADAVGHLAAESSRQCGVCINATAGIRDILAALRTGTATEAELAKMAGWTQRVPGRGACALIDAAARMAASLLREFPAEVAAHLAEPCPRCAALGPPPRMTRHHIDLPEEIDQP